MKPAVSGGLFCAWFISVAVPGDALRHLPDTYSSSVFHASVNPLHCMYPPRGALGTATERSASLYKPFMLHPLLSADAQVSGHLPTFTPCTPRHVRMYCSSFSPVVNEHISPNPSRPSSLVGAGTPELHPPSPNWSCGIVNYSIRKVQSRLLRRPEKEAERGPVGDTYRPSFFHPSMNPLYCLQV